MALHSGKFGLSCNNCDDNQKVDRGCLEDSPIPGRWQIGDFVLERCPLSMISQESCWYIRAYNFMEKGVMPISGGWMEQSNKFVEGMSLIMCEKQRKKD